MALKDNTPLASVMQMRESFISIAARYGEKLKDLRSKDFNPKVAVLKGGGMALRFIPGKPGQYRLGSVDMADVACTTQTTVDMWNRQHPNHEVELVPLQQAVERECSSVCIMLQTIEEQRLRLEGQD
jgi:hypothetical protein